MAPYPKPSAVGGVLIRKVMAEFKANGIKLPLEKPILISVSGGVDSMVLAHLLARYGRRLMDPKLIHLLHLDHGWRPESAGVEKAGVQRLAESLGVGFTHEKLVAPQQNGPRFNLEEDGRKKRKAVYQALAGNRKKFAFVFTAHHQDDVVETLIWRFFRGELFLQSEGILFKDQECLRPFLQVTKEEIYDYARSEKVEFFEDPTNQDTEAFRAFARVKLIPLILEHFPGFKKAILRYRKAL